MRLILLLVLVAGGLYWLGQKAYDAFTLKGTAAEALKIAKIPEPPAKQSAPAAPSSAPSSAPPFASGFLSSVASSLGPSSTSGASSPPVFPTVSRRLSFANRDLPTAETFQALASGSSAGAVTWSIDPVSRSVFLRGPLDVVSDFAEFLIASDQVPGECALRGWVVWVSDSDRAGWDFTAAFSSSLGPDAVKGSVSGGDLLFSATLGDVQAAVSLLRADEGLSFVQEPVMRLLHGRECRIESVEEVPIPSTTISNGLATSSIEYRRVGLEVVAVPSFLGRDRVRLSVTQSGGVVGRSVEVSGNSVPVLQTQKVSSTVEMGVGQTLLLGGVKTSRKVEKKGFLSSSTEFQVGMMYVILTLYSDTPKALPVGKYPDLEFGPLPEISISDDDPSLLPPIKD